MWFAKLFGGREDDSEPSEFPPHPAAQTKVPQSARTAPSLDAPSAPKKAKPGKGFDPYNSGTFDKNKAWNRVIR